MDLSNVGQAGQPGSDRELGEVAQHDRVAADQLVLQHRKHRGSETLGAHLDLSGQGRLERGKTGLDLAQRQLHIGLGPEVEAQLDRAAHRTRADFPETEQPAHRLLQRAGGRDHHLLSLERAASAQHDDAGVSDFRVYGGGEGIERVQSTGGEEPGKQIDCRAISLDSSRNTYHPSPPQLLTTAHPLGGYPNTDKNTDRSVSGSSSVPPLGSENVVQKHTAWVLAHWYCAGVLLNN